MNLIGRDSTIAKLFLEKGELVAIPTETVYGLAGNALVPETVAKIFQAKNRPSFDPLIVHTHSIEQAHAYVRDFPSWAHKLATAFWPGALTLLLPKKELIPDIVTNGSDLVAIRIPNHPVTLNLLRTIDFPLAAPSANPFGYISPTTAQHVADQLSGKLAYILDGGSCEIGLESTIVGLKNNKPAVYRTGGIGIEAIENIVQEKLDIVQSTSNPSAPGMLDSHYSPTKPLYFGANLSHSFPDKKVGIINFQNLSPTHDLSEAACQLFAKLRQLDKSDIEIIIAEEFPNEGLGRAINDRLFRASVKR
jgi:L-threonylcarbamoyladenylate synthase